MRILWPILSCGFLLVVPHLKFGWIGMSQVCREATLVEKLSFITHFKCGMPSLGHEEMI